MSALLMTDNPPRHFAVCIRNDEYEDSLELRKIYQVLPDPVAEKHEMVRVIDEQREDYLYPSSWFIAIELPVNIEAAIVELSRDPKPPPEVKAAWSREIERRMQQIQDGTVELVDWEEVRAELFAEE